MDNYDELNAKYEKLKDEFENYQDFSESTIQMLNEKNNKLEKKLDSLSSIVEISKYINSYISDDNLISMINDMIIGILGVTYSSIYLREKDKLVVKSTNIFDTNYDFYKKEYYNGLEDGEPFVINCKESLFPKDSFKVDIHSVIGVPIYIREKFMGYIIVEHALFEFFNMEHIKFISSIANQIGVALENSFLYTKIKEASRRDPLLGIYNRSYFFKVIEGRIDKNPNRRFAIVMMDIDNFKKANDVYGHQFGDEVLIETAKLIESNIGPKDIVARYGGEEIVIYLSNAEERGIVYDKVDELRLKISNNVVKFGDISGSVTASFGLSYYPGSGSTLQGVIGVADAMMYCAKKSGKNKVISD